MNLIPGGKDFRLSFPDCFGLTNSSELEEAHEPCMNLGLSKYAVVFRVYGLNQLPTKPADCDLHDTRCHKWLNMTSQLNLATYTQKN